MDPKSASLTIGANSDIDRRTQLIHTTKGPITIGHSVRIYRGGEVLGPVTIGDRVFINRDAYIRPNTTIGNDVNIGPFVRLISDSHDIGPATKRAGRSRFDPIIVGDGTWIGASVTILGGVTIGSGCIVAAGSIVTRDIPDNTLAGGVPAAPLRALEP